MNDSDLAALRQLLFKDELTYLASLKKRLDDPVTQAHDISEIIAEALLLRAGKDSKLAIALEPTVESVLKTALRKHPREFTSVLFPLMGPAIRRSIAETFRSMIAGLNKSLEMSFSWRGLRWRFEALRTGKPFAEVVLLHTLLYRVEQVFFIHSETGLVLAHAVNEGVDTQDADMVSAMLTAIQDFARDCFAGGAEGTLNSLQMGDFTIFVERGAEAYLACVVRGTPPPDFHNRLRDSLELMHVECAEALASFNGDTAPFALTHRHLQDCMISRFVDEDSPLPFWIKCLPVLLLLGLVAAYGTYYYKTTQNQKIAMARQAEVDKAAATRKAELEKGVAALSREPGLMVIDVKAHAASPWEVFCLRDDLARMPAAVLNEAGIDPERYHLRMNPYVSYLPEIIARRVGERITPPPTTTLSFSTDGVLFVSGTAPMDWIMQMRQDALSVPGVRRVDTTAVTDPRTEKLHALIQAVESTRVSFPIAQAVPAPEDRPTLVKAVDDLVALEKAAAEMGMNVSLTIYGHADATGSEKRNYELSQERAKTLAAMLYAKGSAIPISIYGMGSDYAAKDDQASRRIEMRVRVTRDISSAGDLLKK